MTGNAAVVLACLKRDIRLLVVEDFAGCFWGRGPDAVDVVGATGTLDLSSYCLSKRRNGEKTE